MGACLLEPRCDSVFDIIIAEEILSSSYLAYPTAACVVVGCFCYAADHMKRGCLLKF